MLVLWGGGKTKPCLSFQMFIKSAAIVLTGAYIMAELNNGGSPAFRGRVQSYSCRHNDQAPEHWSLLDCECVCSLPLFEGHIQLDEH